VSKGKQRLAGDCPGLGGENGEMLVKGDKISICKINELLDNMVKDNILYK
jgi:hypothetical protein